MTIAYFRKHRGWFASLLLRWIYVATLPWNGLMLAQSAMRKRMDRGEAKSIWATLLGIGWIALKRLESPSFRTDSSAAQTQVGGRPALNIFVQRASECLTDYFPNGDGLICFSLLGELAKRGHKIFAYTNRDEVKNRPVNLEIMGHATKSRLTRLQILNMAGVRDVG